MGTEKSLKRPVASFIILTNIIFLPLFLLVVVTIILKLPTVISDIALCISAWSSTFAFMILFKKIYPGKKFLVHVKDRFRNKLKFSTVSTKKVKNWMTKGVKSPPLRSDVVLVKLL